MANMTEEIKEVGKKMGEGEEGKVSQSHLRVHPVNGKTSPYRLLLKDSLPPSAAT